VSELSNRGTEAEGEAEEGIGRGGDGQRRGWAEEEVARAHAIML